VYAATNHSTSSIEVSTDGAERKSRRNKTNCDPLINLRHSEMQELEFLEGLEAGATVVGHSDSSWQHRCGVCEYLSRMENPTTPAEPTATAIACITPTRGGSTGRTASDPRREKDVVFTKLTDLGAHNPDKRAYGQVDIVGRVQTYARESSSRVSRGMGMESSHGCRYSPPRQWAQRMNESLLAGVSILRRSSDTSDYANQ
jgi:hypothetical protein